MKYELAASSWGKEELEAIQKVLNSNRTTMGYFVENFESEFAKFVGSRHCVMVNSGSSANLLMIASLFYRKKGGLTRGDEVIVPAVSWPTTYYPLYQYGLKLKFVDIDLFTLNYDLNKLESAVTDKTRLIVAVNLLGNPNEFNKINDIIRGKNIILIEDNCESLGSEYKNKQTGTWGLIGSYSSFFSHHISTMEGGMIVTDDEEIYQIMLCLRAHGWTRNIPKNNLITSPKSDNQFDELFRFILPGYNLRPIEMMGALGSEQLLKLPRFISNRRENAEYFKRLFSNNPYFYIQQETEFSSWFAFSLIIKPNVSMERTSLTRHLMEKEIEVRPIVAGNFLKNEVLKYFDYEIPDKVENAEYIDKHGFYVGNHHFNIHDKIKYLHEVVADFTGQPCLTG